MATIDFLLGTNEFSHNQLRLLASIGQKETKLEQKNVQSNILILSCATDDTHHCCCCYYYFYYYDDNNDNNNDYFYQYSPGEGQESVHLINRCFCHQRVEVAFDAVVMCSEDTVIFVVLCDVIGQEGVGGAPGRVSGLEICNVATTTRATTTRSNAQSEFSLNDRQASGNSNDMYTTSQRLRYTTQRTTALSVSFRSKFQSRSKLWKFTWWPWPYHGTQSCVALVSLSWASSISATKLEYAPACSRPVDAEFFKTVIKVSASN